MGHGTVEIPSKKQKLFSVEDIQAVNAVLRTYGNQPGVTPSLGALMIQYFITDPDLENAQSSTGPSPVLHSKSDRSWERAGARILTAPIGPQSLDPLSIN